MIRALAVLLWLGVAVFAHVVTFWVDVPIVARSAKSALEYPWPGSPTMLMAGGHWAMFPAIPSRWPGNCYKEAWIIARGGHVLRVTEYLQHRTASPRVSEGFLGPCLSAR